MMRDYVIMTDSASDLPLWLAEELNVEVVPLQFVMGNQTYDNTPDNRDMSLDEFYGRMRTGETVTTNAVNIGRAAEYIEVPVKEGKDVLVLAFSSGLSTTYQSFCLGAEGICEKYPEAKVLVVDTLCASLGQAMLVNEAAKRKAEGMSIEELYLWAMDYRHRQCHWFTVDDLFHLKRGGRVSAATAVVGTMLKIKPVLHMDWEGHLIAKSKARGRKASIAALIEKIDELAIDPVDQQMFICHGHCEEEAEAIAEEIVARYPGIKKPIVGCIGPVIGAHAGPGTLSVFFEGRER